MINLTSSYGTISEFIILYYLYDCVHLRVYLDAIVIHFIKEKCGLKCDAKVSTVLYENSVTCIAQLNGGFIKGDITKYISSKLFFTHDLQMNDDIDVQQICSSDNLTILFITKFLDFNS